MLLGLNLTGEIFFFFIFFPSRFGRDGMSQIRKVQVYFAIVKVGVISLLPPVVLQSVDGCLKSRAFRAESSVDSVREKILESGRIKYLPPSVFPVAIFFFAVCLRI